MYELGAGKAISLESLFLQLSSSGSLMVLTNKQLYMLAFLVTFVVEQEHMVSIKINISIGSCLVLARVNRSVTPCTAVS